MLRGLSGALHLPDGFGRLRHPLTLQELDGIVDAALPCMARAHRFAPLAGVSSFAGAAHALPENGGSSFAG